MSSVRFVIGSARLLDYSRRTGSRHHAQKFQKSCAIPHPQAVQDFLLPASFQGRLTLLRHHGQYRMNGISGPRQRDFSQRAV
jgi:hypothetical protein